MSVEKYHNESQQRVLRVLLALAGREIDGLEPTALAKGLGFTASAITRDLANLRIAGLAERMDSGNWRLAPRMIQIATAYATNFQRARAKLDEMEGRYTRLPR